jgi:hypothetical protein
MRATYPTHLMGRLCLYNFYLYINPLKSRDSSVGIALGYGLDDRGSTVWFPVETGNFSLYHRVQTGSGPTQPPIQCVPEELSQGLKRPEREAGHSPPNSAEVENAWSYTSTIPIRLHGVVLS